MAPASWVEAEANPQMMLYALGALKVYAPIYGDTIREVHLSIVQPNAGGVREWDTTVEALREWGRKGGQARRRPGLGGEGRLCPGRVVPVLPGQGAVLRPGS